MSVKLLGLLICWLVSVGLYIYGAKGFADTVALLSFVSLYAFGIAQMLFFYSGIKYVFNPYHYHLLGVSQSQRFYSEFKAILRRWELSIVAISTFLAVLYFEEWTKTILDRVLLSVLYITNLVSTVCLAIISKNWYANYFDDMRKKGSYVTLSFILLHLSFSQILFGLDKPEKFIEHLAFFNPVGALFYLPLSPFHNLFAESFTLILLLLTILFVWHWKLIKSYVFP